MESAPDSRILALGLKATAHVSPSEMSVWSYRAFTDKSKISAEAGEDRGRVRRDNGREERRPITLRYFLFMMPSNPIEKHRNTITDMDETLFLKNIFYYLSTLNGYILFKLSKKKREIFKRFIFLQ